MDPIFIRSQPTDATRWRRRNFDSSHESVQKLGHRSTRPVPSRSAPCIFPGLPCGPSIHLKNSSPTCRFRNPEVRFPHSRSADPISRSPSTSSPNIGPDFRKNGGPFFGPANRAALRRASHPHQSHFRVAHLRHIERPRRATFGRFFLSPSSCDQRQMLPIKRPIGHPNRPDLGTGRGRLTPNAGT